MPPDSYEFLCELYQNVSSVQPVFVTLTAIHPDGRRFVPSQHIPLGNERGLRRALACLHEANAHGWGAFFAVAPRTRPLGHWHRGGKAAIFALPALFVDIDTKHEEKQQQLQSFSLAPSAIVDSGGGLHAYWFLNEPTNAISHAERLLKGLAHWFGGDNLTAAQSLRLPGTLNTKPQRHGAMCQCIDWQPDLRYTLQDFTAYLPPERPLRQRTPVVDNGAVTEWILRNCDGYLKPNGWIAALCPLGHKEDKAGQHFNWHPKLKIGRCFGRHGRLTANDIAMLV